MGNVTRLDQFAKNPERAWNELRPRIVERALGYYGFNAALANPELVAVIVSNRRELVQGDHTYGEASTQHVADYELIYRDDITRDMQHRRSFEVDDTTARIAFDKRLDLVNVHGVYLNPSLIGRIAKHRDQAVIAPHFDDGAHGDARFKLSVPYYLMASFFTQQGYRLTDHVITQRPKVAPRRLTAHEQYRQQLAEAALPKVEW